MAEKAIEVVDGGAVDELRKLQDELRGHDRIVIEDGDGGEYTLRYPAKVVKEMEAGGITADTALNLLTKGTFSGAVEFVDRFVYPAFKTDQPKVTKAKVLEIFESVPDKQEFIRLLTGLFSVPMLALTTDPTETRAKFRLV